MTDLLRPPDGVPRIRDGPEGLAALERRAVVVPARREAVSVTGADAEAYLQGQCSQDVASLEAGASALALLLTPQGKLDALVRVTRMTAEHFVVDVDAGFAELVVARLLRFRLRVRVDVDLLPWRCVALRGPLAAEVAAELAGPGDVTADARWRWCLGVDVLGPDVAVPDGVPQLADGAWQAERIIMGQPIMGAELDEHTIAAEAGLLEPAVSLTKGCYTGQELVARLDARGNRVARHLRGVVVPGTADAWGATSLVGADILVGEPGAGAEGSGRSGVRAPSGAGGGHDTDGGVVGRVTSAAFSARIGGWVALAYVHRRVQPPASVRVVSRTGGVGVLPGEVRQLPMLRAREPGEVHLPL